MKEEIKEQELDKKVSIYYKEIYYDKDNAKLFDEKVRECEYSSYDTGVPMVYVNGTC